MECNSVDTVPTTNVVKLNSGTHSLPYRIWKRALRTAFQPVRKHQFCEFGSGASLAFSANVVGHCSISIGNGAAIWRHARIDALNAAPGIVRVRIGDKVVISPGVHLAAVESVIIGTGVGIGSYSFITDHDHDISDPFDSIVNNRRLIAAPVEIGEHAWIGEQVIILKGVKIGERSIVGAGSIVTKDIPPLSIAMGAPARVVRKWDSSTKTWEKA